MAGFLFRGSLRCSIGSAADACLQDFGEAAGVTGEVTYVDAGYNILGMTGIHNE